MNKEQNFITVFEHECIRVDKGEKRLTPDQFKALQLYYGQGLPFYDLRYNGVQFNEYVGVIQIGKTLIEVLPKADRNHGNDTTWRNILIEMLRAVGAFDIRMSSESKLRLKPNSILDLYFEMFIKEVEYLLHIGLIKRYRKIEGNRTALKGSIDFQKNIQENLVHQERFYVNYSTYDAHHKLHRILYKTIRLIKRINTNVNLAGRLGNLILDFPEMLDINVNGSDFRNIVFTRKTQSYRNAINIAKLLLLQFHPDVSKGKNDVIALMFDMNLLWEKFIFSSLARHKIQDTSLSAQTLKYFWKPAKGKRSKIKPDIVMNRGRPNCIVLDTKWKNLNGYNPSPDDLRQLYVYHEYYKAIKVALIYPGANTSMSKGKYLDPDTGKEMEKKECSVITLEVNSNIRVWQKEISEEIKKWYYQQ